MNVAVILPFPVVTQEANVYSDTSFIYILQNSKTIFDKIYCIARTDRKKQYNYLYNLKISNFEVIPFKCGIRGKYITILMEFPLLTIKILWILLKIRQKVDIIWIPNMRIIGLLSYFIAKSLGLKVFFYVRGNFTNEVYYRHKQNRTYNLLIKNINKLENKVITGILNNNLTFTCGPINSVNLSRRNVVQFIASSTKVNDIIKSPKSIANLDTIYLLFVGRISKEKGVEYLIKAMSIMKSKDLLNVKLNIVGDGSYKSQLKEMINLMGIKEKVAFYGHINDRETLYNIYDKSHILIIPSLSEGTPKIIPEAMSRGLPIVSTNVGGLPRMIDDEINGFIVNPANSFLIARSVDCLVSSPKYYRIMSSNALIRAQKLTSDFQFFQMKTAIRNYLDIK